jgi:hypothetical protein
MSTIVFHTLSHLQVIGAKMSFRNLVELTPDDGDILFAMFGAGSGRYGVSGANQTLSNTYERFSDYESLLKLLWEIDEEKFAVIHKGTPYYYMAWLSFQIKNFEKAVIYMDSAISEDIRKAIFY